MCVLSLSWLDGWMDVVSIISQLVRTYTKHNQQSISVCICVH